MKQFSIITDEFDKCFLCGSHRMIEVHHIFNASNRNHSTKYGLVIPLCRWCHNTSPHGVHHNAQLNQVLKAQAQEKAMEHYGWTVDDFRKIFGKNYL